MQLKDAEHLSFLRSLPCAMCLAPAPSEAHHSTAHRRGLGMKASDRHTFPLCTRCHDDFHSARGRFRDWKKLDRALWQRTLVDLYNVSPEGKHGGQTRPGEDGPEGDEVDPWGDIF